MPKFYSFSLGFFIDYGSRDEPIKDNGVTHLIEHMLFKGTSQKSSIQIVKLIEGLGGSFDAYTTKENLIIVTKFLSEHLIQVFDLIAEVLLESKIDEAELNKEKSVVLEEIKSNYEDPGEYVFDLFFNALFPNHAIGLPIAGTEVSVKNIDAQKIKSYYQELLKKKMTIAVSGNFNYKKFLDQTHKKFSHRKLQQVQRTNPIAQLAKTEVISKKEISQVHIVFGTSGVGYASPSRYPLSILNTAFGGGMSSRLFQGLREKEGLVYDVHSFIDLYNDCGVTGFYFVCDKSNLKNVAKQLKIIFDDIHKNGFSKEEIELAKTYLSGNLLLSLESSTNRMLRLAREMCHLEKVNTIEEVVNRIRSTSDTEINDLIQEYLDHKKYTIAAIGPIDKNEVEQIFRAL